MWGPARSLLLPLLLCVALAVHANALPVAPSGVSPVLAAPLSVGFWLASKLCGGQRDVDGGDARRGERGGEVAWVSPVRRRLCDAVASSLPLAESLPWWPWRHESRRQGQDGPGRPRVPPNDALHSPPHTSAERDWERLCLDADFRCIYTWTDSVTCRGALSPPGLRHYRHVGAGAPYLDGRRRISRRFGTSGARSARRGEDDRGVAGGRIRTPPSAGEEGGPGDATMDAAHRDGGVGGDATHNDDELDAGADGARRGRGWLYVYDARSRAECTSSRGFASHRRHTDAEESDHVGDDDDDEAGGELASVGGGGGGGKARFYFHGGAWVGVEVEESGLAVWLRQWRGARSVVSEPYETLYQADPHAWQAFEVTDDVDSVLPPPPPPPSPPSWHLPSESETSKPAHASDSDSSHRHHHHHDSDERPAWTATVGPPTRRLLRDPRLECPNGGVCPWHAEEAKAQAQAPPSPSPSPSSSAPSRPLLDALVVQAGREGWAEG